MERQQSLKTIFSLKGMFTLILALIIMQLIISGRASAATIVPSGSCSLDDAVASFNDASDQAGCEADGAYGSNDTLDIPSGNFSYLNSSYIMVPVHIKGSGIGHTTIDLQNNNFGFLFYNTTSNNQSIVVEDMTIINGASNPSMPWVGSSGYSSTFQRLEFYSTTPPTSGTAADSVIRTRSGSAIDSLSTVIRDVYIHNTVTENSAIAVDAEGGRNFTNNKITSNTITKARLTNGVGSAIITVGHAGSPGNTEAIIENNTIEDCEFAGQGTIVVAAAMVFGSGEDIIVKNTIINNTVIMGRNPNTIGSFSTSVGAPDGSSANGQQFLQNNLVISHEDGGVGQGFLGDNLLGLGGDESASTISLGGNIFSDYLGQTLLDQPSDKEIGDIGSYLGPLQDNGGFTPTRALLAGSAAIDAGTAVAGMTTDQRGVARPQGLGFDAGAYEYEPAPTPPSPNTGGSQGNNDQGSKLLPNTPSSTDGSSKLANTGSATKPLIALIAGVGIVAIATAIAFFSRKSRVPKIKYLFTK